LTPHDPPRTEAQPLAPGIWRLKDFAALRARLPRAEQADASSELFDDLRWFELLAAHGWHEPITAPVLLLLEPPVAAQATCLPLRLADGALHSLSNYYSCGYGPIAGPQSGAPAAPVTAAAWCALGKALRQWPQAARLRLQPLAPEGEDLPALARGLRESGYWVDRFFCFGNWYLPCAGLDFDDYLQSRSSRLRHNITRGQRRLSRAGAWEVEICSADDARLAPCLHDFEAVYAASWKRGEAQPEFIRQLVRLLARDGSLRLGVLRAGDQALAAQLWWVRGGRACIYKLAYREDAAHFSAGSVLSAALFRQALERDRVREVDYLSGDDAYKREWMSARRERWGLVAFDPRRGAGLLAALRHYGGRAWHRLVSKFSAENASAP
jgi:hypothetical protein